MRKWTYLVGLAAMGTMASAACVTKIDTDRPGLGGNGGDGGDEGGGGAVGYDALFGSGERLTAVYRDGGDGARIFRHFQDTTLDEACDFAAAADGSVFCLPTQQHTLAYADAACTEPVLVVGPCNAAPAMFSTVLADECGADTLSRRDVYRVGAETTPTEVYRDNGSGCVADASFDAQLMTVHVVSAADMSSFASATLESAEVDDDLGRRIAVSADGAYRVLGAFNTARNEACSLQSVDAGLLCLSSHLAYGRQHSSSATCDTADVAYATTPASCGDPQAVLKSTYANDDLCTTPTITVHAVGDAIDGDVYSNASGTCMVANEPSSRFFAIGGEAADGVLPKLALASAGTGRLTVQQVTSVGGTLIAGQAGWFDTERDEACEPSDTTDGVRCLPAMPLAPTATGTTFFADDQCSVPLLNVAPSACESAPPKYLGMVSLPSDSCAASVVETVYGVGAEHTGPVYQGVAANCAQGTFDGITFYALGDAIGLDGFATLQESTLPSD